MDAIIKTIPGPESMNLAKRIKRRGLALRSLLFLAGLLAGDAAARAMFLRLGAGRHVKRVEFLADQAPRGVKRHAKPVQHA